MGNIYIPLRALLERLGVDYLIPPPITKKTLTIGVQMGPEFACFPLKVNLGNFVEALELGADSIVMAGGIGPCRFGYYAQVQKKILEDYGYKFDMYILNQNPKVIINKIREIAGLRITLWDMIREFSFGWKKLRATEEMEILAHKIRPYELKRRDTTKAYRKALKLIDDAETDKEVKEARDKGRELMNSVPTREPREGALKVVIVGEIYTILEPFVNFDLEIKLGEMGIEVERMVYLSHWLEGLVPIIGGKQKRKVYKAARPYLKYPVGGEGMESIGNTVLYAKRGFDGVIHLLPFTCMPEIVARSILPKVSRDFDIPVMTLILDEQTGEAGLVTRVEAFIDLMARKHDIKITSGAKIPPAIFDPSR